MPYEEPIPPGDISDDEDFDDGGAETPDDEEEERGWRTLLFTPMLMLTAFWRFCFFHFYRADLRRRRYSAGSSVAGYAGWYEDRVHGVIAFERENGTRQFRW